MSLPKSPEDMNLDELRLLLEIRKLELKNSLQEVKHRLGIGGRILKAIQKSGIIESFAQTVQSYTANPQTSSASSSQSPATSQDENSSSQSNTSTSEN
ncbi:MAG: hypothetical protein JJT78_09045 [Leptospira sp.]|nr:hypothetical protein [Leptospira sp.]